LTYNLHCIKDKIFIKAENFVPIWKSLLVSPLWRGDEKKPRTFIEMCDQIGFHPSVDADGNIIKLGWTESFSGYAVDDFFMLIAPFVDSGTMHFVSEHGVFLTYKFHDTLLDAGSKKLVEEEE